MARLRTYRAGSIAVFSTDHLHDTWKLLVAGWADHLDPSGALLVADGVRNHADAIGSYEGTTRMMWGLGSWLEDDDRDDSIVFRERSYNIRKLTRRALVKGTDPTSSGYWGVPVSTGTAQPTVESGQVAFAIWQSRHRIWVTLDPREREQIGAWLIACGEPPKVRWRNNWALFWALNHTVRRQLDLPHDQALVADVLNRYLDDVYCGDGWYDDGPSRGTNHFDDYNLWVFASHVLAIAHVTAHDREERMDELLGRIRRQMEHVPWFFAANGSYPEFGRSLAYKFARLGSLLWAYRLGAWPHSVELLKTIVCRHVDWYVRRGAIRADGTLRQSLTSEGSVGIREPYISTGAPYWAIQAFSGLWSLSPDDPFWTANFEPLPVERANFIKVYPQPGWILSGTKASGQVHRFSGHSSSTPAKYGKIVYSTGAPFNVGLSDGLPTPDAMFSLVDDGVPGHRNAIEASLLDESGWMRFIWRQAYAGIERVIDTTIVVRGDWHLRVHRIEPEGDADHALLSTFEGAAAVGYSAGETPRVYRSDDPPSSCGAASGRCVAIVGWDGRRSLRPATWRGAEAVNAVYGLNVIPALSGDMVPGELAVAEVYIGRENADVTGNRAEPIVRSGADQNLSITWRDEEFTIPRPHR